MAHSVYVHVPFCLSRCLYCAFYSGEPLRFLDEYADLVACEVGLRRRAGWAGRVETVYFGGGTPALLTVKAVERVLGIVDRTWGLVPGAEISLEVNPSTDVDLRGLRLAGVNRISVGVQCLDDALLARLGRTHRVREARETLAAAARAGFDSVSADLLYGVPGLAPQHLRAWIGHIDHLGVDHLSAYSLELHPGTPLAQPAKAGAFQPLDPDQEAAQWDALTQAVEEAGYQIYEVSNFARPGLRCRHNVAYWDGSSYLGLGPGAHSYAPNVGPWGTRSWNAPNLRVYADHVRRGELPPGGRERLSRDESLLEALFLALRRSDPIDLASLSRTWSVESDSLATTFERLRTRGLVRTGPELVYSPTKEAMRLADGLALWIRERLAFQGPVSTDGSP